MSGSADTCTNSNLLSEGGEVIIFCPGCNVPNLSVWPSPQLILTLVRSFGVYDIFVKLEADSAKEIEDAITKKIRKTKHVLSTTTLSVIPEQG